MYLILLILGYMMVWKCIRLDRDPRVGEDGNGRDLLTVFGWYLGAILIFIGVVGAIHELYKWVGLT